MSLIHPYFRTSKTKSSFESDLATTEGPNSEDDLPTTEEATVTEKTVPTEKPVTEAVLVTTEKVTIKKTTKMITDPVITEAVTVKTEAALVSTEKVTTKKTTEMITDPVTTTTEMVTEPEPTTVEVTTKTELRAATYSDNDVDTILSGVDDDSLIKADNLGCYFSLLTNISNNCIKISLPTRLVT